MIKIIAVDDSKAYLKTLEDFFRPIKDKFNLIQCFSTFKDEFNVEHLLAKIGEIKPDVVLMDYSFVLEGQSEDYGIYLVKAILAKYPHQKIIMLASTQEDASPKRWDKIQRSFEAGASAFLLKKDDRSWKEGITEVVSGENYVNKNVVHDILNGLKVVKNKEFDLTERQIEIISHLAADKTIKEVAACIKSSNDKFLTSHGVTFHIRNLKPILGIKTLHGLVALALRKKIIN